MIYCFDLDGTLCTQAFEGNYLDAEPYPERIEYVNQLHADGHRVIIDSARGSITGEDWYERTDAQLRKWGLLFDMLRTGEKFFADCYVDDKGVSAGKFFECVSDRPSAI